MAEVKTPLFISFRVLTVSILKMWKSRCFIKNLDDFLIDSIYLFFYFKTILCYVQDKFTIILLWTFFPSILVTYDNHNNFRTILCVLCMQLCEHFNINNFNDYIMWVIEYRVKIKIPNERLRRKCNLFPGEIH